MTGTEITQHPEAQFRVEYGRHPRIGTGGTPVPGAALRTSFGHQGPQE